MAELTLLPMTLYPLFIVFAKKFLPGDISTMHCTSARKSRRQPYSENAREGPIVMLAMQLRPFCAQQYRVTRQAVTLSPIFC